MQRGNIAYPTKWYQGWINTKQLSRYLDLCVRSLEYLDGRGDLHRNNALFLVACLKTELEYAKYGYYLLEQAQNNSLSVDISGYVMGLNDSLTDPLAEEEPPNWVSQNGSLSESGKGSE